MIILAVISAIITVGTVEFGEIGLIVAKAILFLAGAIIIGQLFASKIGKLLSKISPCLGMKFTFAICFCLIFAYLAQKIGLAPIVGAFAAGLVLDPVHFCHFKDPQIVNDLKETIKDMNTETKEKITKVIKIHAHRHIEDIIAPIGHFFIPVFFITTCMAVKLETMFDIQILLVAVGITVAAFIGKIISGIAAGKVNKSIVGLGMVPRGEVGLIFATIGKSLNVMSDEVYSIIVIVVILTTFLTPPVLTFFLKKER